MNQPLVLPPIDESSDETRVAETPSITSQPVASGPTSDRLTPPDGFELLRCVGQGGMGSVWQAEQTLLNRRVAIKFIKPTLPVEQLSERFAIEARACARLTHPGVVSVYDFGKVGDCPYLIMEWLDGRGLEAWIAERGRLTATETARLGVNLADTLRAAHAADIVHRDIKPGNIVLVPTASGTQPKIVDFGIAKLSASSERKLTRMGQPIGSPEYMAPEQVMGSEHIDQRADVWGLCATLYECLTGLSPFAGTDDRQLFEAILEWPVGTPAGFGVKDDGLWEILERGLKKSPKDRWQSMAELGEALSLWLIERGETSDIAGQALQRRWTKPPIDEDQAPGDLAKQLLSPPPRYRGSLSDAEPFPLSAVRKRRRRKLRAMVAVLMLGIVGGFGYYQRHTLKQLPDRVERELSAAVPEAQAAPADGDQAPVATLEPTFALIEPEQAPVPPQDAGPDSYFDASQEPRKPVSREVALRQAAPRGKSATASEPAPQETEEPPAAATQVAAEPARSDSDMPEEYRLDGVYDDSLGF
ncbi:MAG: protein kinase [Polyangiaceae bacterium]